MHNTLEKTLVMQKGEKAVNMTRSIYYEGKAY